MVVGGQVERARKLFRVLKKAFGFSRNKLSPLLPITVPDRRRLGLLRVITLPAGAGLQAACLRL